MRFLFIFLMVVLTATAALAAETAKPETGRWAVIETSKGTIKFSLYEKDAPITTKNFIELANRKFYDGLTFHRVEPGFVIQGGDPNGNGSGGSEKTIKLEVTPKLKHDAAGIVAMARRRDLDSASCQFYITLAPLPQLDGQYDENGNPVGGYAVFGRVTEGLDVVQKIEVGDTIKSVRIVQPPAPKKVSPKKPEAKPNPDNDK